ncbi:chemotaxis response regulator protein-glutamate methylesterase [Pararhodobacter sp. CCB-MM2]|uniref:protein-glutamate methylesterase/protein-glutamine glutaminase n=1 Tax=Pararhodobacter sp. CCB-MM2 TaxID=1786003 RepID=UPI00082E62EF|nr:chemotaxis response regulator protein-glutamate methylesterase [Pararhodobacter sp. CCB-MM2]
MGRISVLIVDDSLAARAMLKDLLAEDSGIEVIGTASDPFEAAAMMRDVLPDVLILDLELPRMNGLTFLSKIMQQNPMPVVICSSHTEAGSKAALRALEIGASEVIGKPRLASAAARQEAQILLTDAVRAAAAVGRSKGFKNPRRTAPPPKPAPFTPGPKLTADAILPPPRKSAPMPPDLTPLIAIGASTGGTEALADLLPRLAADTPPVVITQHMPEKFTATFARRLDLLSKIEVREAVDGDRTAPGLALIAPGDKHMVLRRQGRGYRVSIVDGPQVSRHRPSVDVLFRSVAIAAGSAAMGIILTGMGDDGARGLLEMREAGAETLAQDEASSVVWGMPGEAVRLGATGRQVPLSGIGPEISKYIARTRNS